MARVNRTGNFLEDKKMAKKIGTVEEALQDLRDGKVILVMMIRTERMKAI